MSANFLSFEMILYILKIKYMSYLIQNITFSIFFSVCPFKT